MSLILIVDDAQPLAEQYAYDLKRLGGHDTLIAADGDDGARHDRPGAGRLRAARSRDAGDGRLRGAAPAARSAASSVPVIVYTGTGNYDRCAQAIRLGAVSFIDKAEPMERVVQEIAGALERRRLEREVEALRRGSRRTDTSLIGSSPADARSCKDAIARVAPIPRPC